LRKLYWDTSIFLCFLNQAENDRREICEDILQNAQNGEVTIYTSAYTIAEVIRPKHIPKVKSRLLTANETGLIRGMFKWPWIKKISLDPRIADAAVELARTHGLWPADAVHAASALSIERLDALQAWDRDFSYLGGKITVEEPQLITKQLTFLANPPIGPQPKDFPPKP
jgi:predicted nucleic acid-binding protein